MKIVVYQKPTCTTCRQVHAALKESGVDFDAIDYYLDPIPKKKLLELLRKMAMRPRELLRTKEPVYKTLRIAERDLSERAGMRHEQSGHKSSDLIRREHDVANEQAKPACHCCHERWGYANDR